MTAADQARIRDLVAQGWTLLARGRPGDAAHAFSRVVLVDPSHGDAQRGLAAARAAVVEGERELDARLEEARLAAESGDSPRARELVEAVLASGGDRDRAVVLLDRLDLREGRLQGGPATASPEPDPKPRSARDRAWSRPVFAAACVSAFVVLGAGVASSWDRLLAQLARTPVPQSRAAVYRGAEAPGDRALAEARRLLDAGDPAGALAALDAVSPQEPAWPLARRLRRQAERTLGMVTPAASAR